MRPALGSGEEGRRSSDFDPARSFKSDGKLPSEGNLTGKGNGMIDEIGYEAFLKQYQEENKKKADERRGRSHGPLELSVSQYYSYRQSQLKDSGGICRERLCHNEEELKAILSCGETGGREKKFPGKTQPCIFEDAGEEQKAAAEQ